MAGERITRRTLIAGGVVAGSGLVALPAWARPLRHVRRHRPRHERTPDSLPSPDQPPGTPGIPAQVDTVVVLMLENHSFDNILGLLPYQVPARRGVDGLPGDGHVPTASNLDRSGKPVRAFHLPDNCPSTGLTQAWDASHAQYDNGRNDGFVTNVGTSTPMGYFDSSDLPVTYALASQFPISERYFASTLCQTEPNRRFLFAGTASGVISDQAQTFTVAAANGTIFDRLDAAKISWLDYYDNAPSPFYLPNVRNNPLQAARMVKNPQFFSDAAAGRLPQVSFVEPNYNYQSEENPQDVGYGEQFLAQVVAACTSSPQWRSLALFVTYDEHGGFYDHVPPPSVIPPDDIPPDLKGENQSAPGGYDRYGFRVPFIVVSPWARPNYVSRVVADHTSILSFIEHRWNLPALTRRDANAWNLSDMFDVSAPHFLHAPALPPPPSTDASLAKCRADGENPPAANDPNNLRPV
jgi:phospholipase C